MSLHPHFRGEAGAATCPVMDDEEFEEFESGGGFEIALRRRFRRQRAGFHPLRPLLNSNAASGFPDMAPQRRVTTVTIHALPWYVAALLGGRFIGGGRTPRRERISLRRLPARMLGSSSVTAAVSSGWCSRATSHALLENAVEFACWASTSTSARRPWKWAPADMPFADAVDKLLFELWACIPVSLADPAEGRRRDGPLGSGRRADAVAKKAAALLTQLADMGSFSLTSGEAITAGSPRRFAPSWDNPAERVTFAKLKTP